MGKTIKIIISIGILAGVAGVYFICRPPGAYLGNEGIFCTNDGSMYAGTRAIADEKRFDLTETTRRFTDGDMVKVGDLYYSNKPIGTYLAATPFYYLGSWLADSVVPKTNKIFYAQLGKTAIGKIPTGGDYPFLAGSFIAESENLEKIQIMVSQDREAPTDLVIKITKDKNNLPSDEPDVGKAQIISPYKIGKTWQYLTMPYPAKLEKGAKYWLVIQPYQMLPARGFYNVSMGAVPLNEGAVTTNVHNQWNNTEAAPFFKLYSTDQMAPTETLLAYEKDRLTIFSTSLLATVSALLAVLMVFLILHSIFKLSFTGSWLTAIVMAFGTLNWEYSRVLFYHTFSAFLILLSLYLLFSITIQKRERLLNYIVFGLVLGCSMTVDYTNLWFGAGVLIYLLIFFIRRKQFVSSLKNAAAAAIGLFPPVFGLLYFHCTQFGSIFSTSYKYYTDFPVWLDKNLWFTKDHLSNIGIMLFGKGAYAPFEEIYGLFYCVPFVILSFVGLYFFYKKSRGGAWLILGVSLAILASVSFFYTVYGGGSHNYRYVIGSVVLLILPLGFFIDKFICQRLARGWNVLIHFVFWGLVCFSFCVSYLKITHQEAHTVFFNLALIIRHYLGLG